MGIRRKVIAGNWKMNLNLPEAENLLQQLIPLVKDVHDVDIIVCPTFVCLSAVGRQISATNIHLGAQDLHWEKKGAFTGKVSGSILKSAGVEYVIIGHSEQRTFFHETNETVNKKIKAALAEGLKPIVCVGEVLSERESGKTEAAVRDHVEGAFAGLTADQAGACIIAYEPVWAIGTGKTASPAQAQEVHLFIRKIMEKLYSRELAEKVRIQYGGSMKADNAAELLAQPDIDGGLIGGAALEAKSFTGIIKYRG